MSPDRRWHPRAVGAQRFWGIADQGASSLTNFTAGFFVLQACSRYQFGVYGLVFSIYVLVLTVGRAGICDPLLIRLEDDEAEARVPLALGASLALGLVSGAALASIAVLLPRSSQAAVFALAIGLPGLFLQDVCRYVLIAQKKARSAFLNDVFWGLLVVLGTVSLAVRGAESAGPYLAVWTVAGALAAVVGLAQVGVLPRIHRAGLWFRSQGDLARPLIVEVLVRRGGPQIAAVAVSSIIGFAGLGLLNTARLVISPLNVISLGLQTLGLVEGAAIWRNRPEALRAHARRISLALAALPLLLAGAFSVAPAGFVSGVLNADPSTLRPYVILIGISTAALGWNLGTIVGLRVIAAVRESLRLQLVISPLLVLSVVGGALVGGGVGAAAGFAFAPVVGAVVGERLLRRGLAAAMVEGVAAGSAEPSRVAFDSGAALDADAVSLTP